jgi:hypothetical protein
MEDEKKTDETTAASDNANTAKQWLQDNLRIIISVIIVVLIAGGIYSYSQRTGAPIVSEQAGQESVLGENNETGAVTNESTSATDKSTQKVTTATSQETENSFVETAGKGDGTTVLARRALANYLEKNSDPALTAEHKIYIEDFMRKNVPQKRIFAGTSVEFSKDLVQKAITQAKTLNANQLKNLHKYAVRVPSLS